jgi:hypothetical protein
LTRAPRFDELWAEHRKLIFWWSHRLAQIFGRLKSEEYLGWLTLRFNEAATSWDVDKGANFSTWFSYHIVRECQLEVVARESDGLAAWLWNKMHRTKRQVAVMSYDFGELREMVPVYIGTDDWTADVMELFDSGDACWKYLTATLSAMEKLVIDMRYRDGMTYAQVSERLGFTKQRAQQLGAKAMDRVAARVAKLNQWNAMWKKGGGS